MNYPRSLHSRGPTLPCCPSASLTLERSRIASSQAVFELMIFLFLQWPCYKNKLTVIKILQEETGGQINLALHVASLLLSRQRGVARPSFLNLCSAGLLDSDPEVVQVKR